MAFRASNVVPQDGYERAKRHAVRAQVIATNRSASFASGAGADEILSTYQDLRRERVELANIAAITGIADYAQAQESDNTYNVAAEFTALTGAIDSVLANIESTFPTDAGGYLLEKKLNAQGTYDFRQFTGAQLATLRGLLDTLAAQVS